MKQSEFKQLIEVIERIVAKEIRKQLPTVISETFQNMMGKKMVTEEREPNSEPVKSILKEKNFNGSATLKEIFAGATPNFEETASPKVEKSNKVFAKDPILNQILNETVNDIIRKGSNGSTQNGPSVSWDANASAAQNLQIGTPPILREGQESSHAPLSTLQEGVSVLDVRNHVATPVKNALTRNYSELMKAINKKGKVAV